jgi:hypothetical protein
MTSREALFRYQMLSQVLGHRLAGKRQAEAVRSGVSRASHFTPSEDSRRLFHFALGYRQEDFAQPLPDLLYDARAPPCQGNVASIVIATLRRMSTLPAKNGPLNHTRRTLNDRLANPN